MPPTRRWLYLFSSNQSPLYEQDILDVLAAPRGLSYTFRYDPRYVEGEAVKVWSKDGLQDKRVLVVYSIQQEGKYHDPVFLPVRTGCVTDARREGSRLFVSFTLEDHVGLPETNDKHGENVKAFSSALRALTKVPYEASASLGKAPAGEFEREDEADASSLFERTADYLSRTESFRSARFVRFARLGRTGGGDGLRATGLPTAFELAAGTTYDLQLVHSQRRAPDHPEPYVVDADGEIVRVVGREEFDIASRYDLVTVRLHAATPDKLEVKETVLDIHPGQGVQGPRIAIPIRVLPPTGRTVATAAVQAALLIVVALPAVFTHLDIGVKLLIAGLGALGAAFAPLWGIQVLKAPTLPKGAEAKPVAQSTTHTP